MSELNDFEVFLQGSGVDDEIEYIASKRFKGENGNVVPWKLKAISAEKNNAIRKECTINKSRKNGGPQFDETKYMSRLCAESVVYPNLRQASFQDAIGVKTPEALLTKLLIGGEYDRLQAKVLEINGYEFDMDELVEQAKN